MKKLRFLSALLLTTGLMALSPGKALAQDYPVLDVLELGENTDITIGAVDNEDRETPDGFNLYSFVAPKTGVLTIAASGEGDSYGALFNEDWELLTRNDDCDGNSDFRITCQVIAGETYFIGLRAYGAEIGYSGYTITIEYATMLAVNGTNSVEIEAVNFKDLCFIPSESGTYFFYPDPDEQSFDFDFIRIISDSNEDDIPFTLDSDTRDVYPVNGEDFFLVTNLEVGSIYRLRLYNGYETPVNCALCVHKAQADEQWTPEINLNLLMNYHYFLPEDYLYATFTETGENVTGTVAIGTKIKLHAVAIPGLTFKGWTIADVDLGKDVELTVSPEHFGISFNAIYELDEGSHIVNIIYEDGVENVTCNGLPFIVMQNGTPKEVTIQYYNSPGYVLNYINYSHPDDEGENVESRLDDVVNVPNKHQFTGTLPADCLDLFVYFKCDLLNLWVFYNEDYSAIAIDLTEDEPGVYQGILGIEADQYDDLNIYNVANYSEFDHFDTSVAEDVLTITLYDEDNNPTSVYNLNMVKGHEILLRLDYTSSTLSIEGSYYMIYDDYDDVYESLDVFIPEGKECKVTAVSNDPEEYTFIKWTSWDDETEIELTEPTLTLNASSSNYWEVVFSSKSYAKVWLTTYPVDGVYAWLEDEDNPGYKIYNNIGFVNPDDVNSYWTNYITVKKGTKLTLRYEIEEGFDYTFVSWINAATGEVFEGKSPTVEVTDDIDFAGFFKRSVTTNNGWMSYCGGSYNYAVEGGKAYEAKYQEGDGDEPASVVLTSIEGYINSMSGILIYSETGTADIVYTNEGAYELPDNQLLGNCSDVSFKLSESEFAGMPMYGLYNQVPGNIGFQLYTGDILPPHKAVLIPETSAPEIPFEAPLRIVIDNEEVGIIQVTGDQIPFDAIFDLLGRRQNNAAAKGLLIKEGQVVLER